MKFLADLLSCYSGSVRDNSPKIEACSLVVQVACLEENTTRGRKLARRSSSSKGLWQPSLYTISEHDTIKAPQGIKATTKKTESYRRPKTYAQACGYYNDLRIQAQFQANIMAISAAAFVF